MSQNIIPSAFEAFRNQQEIAGQPLVLDEILLANIPHLNPDKPVNRDTVVCQPEWVVHRQAPTQAGVLNHQAVAYALVLDTRVGDFSFNAMFLTHKASGTIAMAVYKGNEDKLATTPTQTGNSLVKTLVMQYDGAAAATQLHVDASSWMVDYQGRFAGLMQDDVAANMDMYGKNAFLTDAFMPQLQGDNWHCAAGVAYVSGIRCEMTTTQPVTGTGPLLVLDVWQQGTATGAWQTEFALRQCQQLPESSTDAEGFHHYYALVARYTEGQWYDARTKGGLEKHLLATDPHSQYVRKDHISSSLTLNSQQHVASAQALSLLKKRVDYSVALGQGAVSDMGQWDASTGSYPAKPYVTDDAGQGQTVSGFWLVTKGGTVQGVEYGIGDKLNYTKNEDTFFKTDNTESVTSINGRKGAVNLTLNDFAGTAGNAGMLAGSSKEQIIATARAGLSANGHTHDDRYYPKGTSDARYQPKGSYAASNHTHDDRYLGKNARAADAAKLEGSSKAQIIAAAKNSYSEKLLWQNAAGLGTGTIVLSEPYTIFNALLIISSYDSKTYLHTHLVTKTALDFAKGKKLPLNIIAQASAEWIVTVSADNRTLAMYDENAVIFAIYGVTF